jgi:hypothetical protein
MEMDMEPEAAQPQGDASPRVFLGVKLFLLGAC